MKGDIMPAAAAAEEMLQATPAGNALKIQRARALVMRARCRAEQHQVLATQHDLDEAWQLLSSFAQSSMFSAVKAGLASWWEVTARVRSESNDPAGAAEALGKAVEFRRIVSQMPQLDGPERFFWLADTLQKYGVALTAAGDPEAAIKAFDECRRICQEIGGGVPGGGTM